MTQPRPIARTMLVPRTVDDLAESLPDQVWISLPRCADLTQGWCTLTFKDLARAVNGMAWWIESTIGVSSNRETVAYMGLNDPRYAVVFLALLKTGYKILFPSPQNSVEGRLSLLKHTYCSKVLCSEAVQAQLDDLSTAVTGLKVHQIPQFEDVFGPAMQTKHYEGYESEAEDEHVVIFHTSGSTGLPKPIPLTNGGLAGIARVRELPVPEGRQSSYSELLSDWPMFTMMPLFFMGGFTALVRSILCQGPLVMSPVGSPVNADLVRKILDQAKPWSLFIIPSMLEEISARQEGLDTLSHLQYVFTGGAPLAPGTGDKVSHVTNLVLLLGSSEAGAIPSLLPTTRDDWEYFEWVPDCGVEMQIVVEGLCEMVIKKVPDKPHQAILRGFIPDQEEWRMNDLWEQHPTKPTLWRYSGRNDDLIVLSSGAKVNPIWFEKKVEEHPAVKTALVVGRNLQVALLIEPDWIHLKDEDPRAIINEIWLTVEEANRVSPAHGHIRQHKILLAKPDKPFMRVSKGSIVRKATAQLYETEINALFAQEDYERLA